jgi:hypothetical protein
VDIVKKSEEAQSAKKRHKRRRKRSEDAEFKPQKQPKLDALGVVKDFESKEEVETRTNLSNKLFRTGAFWKPDKGRPSARCRLFHSHCFCRRSLHVFWCPSLSFELRQTFSQFFKTLIGTLCYSHATRYFM